MLQNATGRPTGITGDGKQFVFFRGVNARLQIAWWDGRWRCNEAPTPAGAEVAGEIAAYYFFHGWHAFYRGADGHVHEVYTEGDEVRHTDVTAAAGFLFAADGDPTAFLFGNQQHVVVPGGGQLHQLLWDGSWAYANLHFAIGVHGTPPRPAGRMAPSGVRFSRSQHDVYYADPNGQVGCIRWHATEGLRYFPLPDLAPTLAPPRAFASDDGPGVCLTRPSATARTFDVVGLDIDASRCSSMAVVTSFAGGPAVHVVDNDVRLFGRSPEGAILESWGLDRAHCLYQHHDNVSMLADHAADAVSDVTVWKLGDGDHVVYRGRDSHVHELYWDGRWKHTDLHAVAR